MKKIILAIIMTLTLCFANLAKVNAETIEWKAIKLYGTEKKVYRRYTKADGTKVDSKTNIAYIYIGENPVFCIEMGELISDNILSGVATTTNIGKLNEYFKTNTDKDVVIGGRTMNVLDAVGLISKYGAQWSKQSKDINLTTQQNLYYLAAQQMIWQVLAEADVYGGPITGNIEIFYKEGSTEKTIDLTDYKNNIIRSINGYYRSPNIEGTMKTPQLSEDNSKYIVTMKDNNNLLNNFTLRTSDERIICEVVDKSTLTCSYSSEIDPPAAFMLYFDKKGTSSIDKVFKVGNNNQATLLTDKTPDFYNFKAIGLGTLKQQLKITKTDSNNNKVLEGVTYQLCSDKNCEVGIKDPNNLKEINEIQTTDRNGVVTFYDLELNTDYYLKEIETINGYILDSEVKTINIKTTDSNYDSNTSTYSVSYTNEKEVVNGYLKINKIDKESKEPLEGITFEVYDINDKVIETLKTDKDGKATTKLLPKGTYYIKEKETLKDYVLLEDEKVIDITENNKTYELAFENEKSPKTADTNILLVITIAICTLVCAIIIYIKKVNLVKNNTI